jgi:hypothetical protein
MSSYKRFVVDRIQDYPLSSRRNKVSVTELAKPLDSDSLSAFFESLPDLLAAKKLKLLADRLRRARDKNRSIIWAFGGHVIKVGLGPILIRLMEQGFATAFATNGSGMIHDFEIALCGGTSEDVESQLSEGKFGMARETGECLNRAIAEGVRADVGIGESVGRHLENAENQFPEHSLLLQAHRRKVPVTVHVAWGTDIIHNHPLASGEDTGKGTQIDFQIFTAQVKDLEGGGVFLNLGSAVILPEVFLKAVSMVLNAGRDLSKFTTVNFDFVRQYRPQRNVVERPVAEGDGISLTGHHEIMIPLLAAMLR